MDEPEIEGSDEASEELKEKIVKFSRETLQVGISTSDIAEARRLGKKKTAIADAGEAGRTSRTPRPLLIKFSSTKIRRQFTSGRTRLKGKSIYLNDDLTPGEQARRRSLIPVYKALKETSKTTRCHLSRDRLIIEGKEQTSSDIAELCRKLNSPRPGTGATPADPVDSASQSSPPTSTSA